MLTLNPEEQTWLDKYRKAIGKLYPGAVLRMVIYGSKTHGDAHEDSDIDMLIIVKNESNSLKRPLRRVGYDLAATSWAVPSIMAYTQAEWDRLETLRSTYREAVERDGVSVL